MALVHRNSQSDTHLYDIHFGGDPMSAPAIEGFPITPSYLSAGAEDSCQKVRKPYTITKSRENWSEMEHEKFLEALHLFDRDWKKIKAFVASKSVIQIRSHAQKYFMKIQKNGTSEHVPPPRPKRKAAHPYPHKAPKKAALLDSEYAIGPQSMTVPRNIISSNPLYPLTSVAPAVCASPMSRDDCALSGGSMNWSSNSNDSTPHIWDETNGQSKDKLIGKRANYIKKERIRYLPEELLDKCFDVFSFSTFKIIVYLYNCLSLSYVVINFITSIAAAALPDFAQVYRFIGSLFDPSAKDQLEELKKMDTIDIETVLMLMNNLAVNLVSPEFKNYRELLSSYNVDTQNDYTGSETSS